MHKFTSRSSPSSRLFGDAPHFGGKSLAQQADARSRTQPAAEPRQIPTDHEAERAVQGAILLDHNALYKVEDKLSPASFDLPRHRTLFQGYLDLAAKRQAITLITLRNYLAEHGVLDEVGGVVFLSELVDVTPTAAHVEHHADLVRDKALARALIHTCERIAADGYEGATPLNELVEDAEREILQIALGHAPAVFKEVRHELQGAFDYIEKIQEGKIVGVQLGFEDLDKKLGGLQGGDLVVLAARPSMGKTSLALNIAANHARDQGGCVVIFSLEMVALQLVLRLLVSEAEIDFGRFRSGLLGDRDMGRLTHAASSFQEQRIFLDDSAVVSVSDISARARRLDRDEKLSLIIVDYIQLIQGRGKEERREQAVADISRSLKMLAKELDVPVIALSQLNRGPENRTNTRPVLADLRESGAIEQDADVVIFIYRDELYDSQSPDEGIAEIHIAKHRNGPVGTVRLQFDGRYTRFNSLSGREPATPVTSGFETEDPPF